MKVSLAFLKYSYFFVREKTVKHFLCWKKFQFPGLGSNHPIPTLIEVLTQTANNQNAFFSKYVVCIYIIYDILTFALCTSYLCSSDTMTTASASAPEQGAA